MHVKNKKSPNLVLSNRDIHMARWFLLNGAMFHFYSDFLVGFFGHDYKINDIELKALSPCDKRYATPMDSVYGAPLHAVALLEGLIMAPTTQRILLEASCPVLCVKAGYTVDD